MRPRTTDQDKGLGGGQTQRVRIKVRSRRKARPEDADAAMEHAFLFVCSLVVCLVPFCWILCGVFIFKYNKYGQLMLAPFLFLPSCRLFYRVCPAMR